MIACEPKTILALPKGLRSESSFLEDGGVGIIQMLSTLYDKQLSGIVDWVKEIPGINNYYRYSRTLSTEDLGLVWFI